MGPHLRLRDLAGYSGDGTVPGGAVRGSLCARQRLDSKESSKQVWEKIGRFARFLSEQDDPPGDLDALTPTHWTAWRISRSTNSSGHSDITRISSLLRADPRLRKDTREATAKRLPKIEVQEVALTDGEFQEARIAARKMFRSAHLRIRENSEVLRAWRAGELAAGTDQWRIGELLDFLAHTGHVPRRPRANGAWRVIPSAGRLLGGESAKYTWQRLYLNRMEAAALAMLLAADFGFNATTIGEMPAPRATPDSGEGGAATYRLELEKRRRGGGHHFETRNVTDLGTGTPGRLITQALEATALARAFVRAAGSDLDPLLIWHETRPPYPGEKGVPRVGPLAVGLDVLATQHWSHRMELEGASMRRMRKTVNVLHRREPGQNVQDTHDRVYVMNEPQAQQAAIPVIAQGVNDALEAARRTMLAQLTDTRLEGDQETATADCSNFHNSPFTPEGFPCDASFLSCLACTNARVTPDHHPRLVLLHRALKAVS